MKGKGKCVPMSHKQMITRTSPCYKAPKRREDSIPDEESEDFRAKDQPSGVMDAQ